MNLSEHLTTIESTYANHCINLDNIKLYKPYIIGTNNIGLEKGSIVVETSEKFIVVQKNIVSSLTKDQFVGDINLIDINTLRDITKDYEPVKINDTNDLTPIFINGILVESKISFRYRCIIKFDPMHAFKIVTQELRQGHVWIDVVNEYINDIENISIDSLKKLVIPDIPPNAYLGDLDLIKTVMNEMEYMEKDLFKTNKSSIMRANEKYILLEDMIVENTLLDKGTLIYLVSKDNNKLFNTGKKNNVYLWADENYTGNIITSEQIQGSFNLYSQISIEGFEDIVTDNKKDCYIKLEPFSPINLTDFLMLNAKGFNVNGNEVRLELYDGTLRYNGIDRKKNTIELVGINDKMEFVLADYPNMRAERSNLFKATM